MEEDTKIPSDISSVDIAKTLQRSLYYVDRKRKFQGEQLGIPPPKHVCSDQTCALEYDFSSKPNPEGQVLYQVIVKPELTGMAETDEVEQDSTKHSNSVGADSIISISGDAEFEWYSEECSLDEPSTSSTNSRVKFSNNPQHTSDSRSTDKAEMSSIEKEPDHNHHNFALHSCMNYEDHLLEYGGHADFSYSEDRKSFEDSTDRELEKMLYSNGVIPNNYVLSSGRWTVNQDAQQGHKKLTIDKEFEQYFSSLML